MAKTTCAKFTYATFVSGGDGSSAPSYSDGVMLEDYLAKCEITLDRTDEKEYADGHLIDSEKIATAAHMITELVNNNTAIKKGVLGMTEAAGGSGDLLQGQKDPPFVGAGVLMANRFKGVITWEGYWMYKIQFAHQGVSAETRRDRTNWQHDTINGDTVAIKLPGEEDVSFFAHKDGMTETAATAWLKAHAGISDSSPAEETTSAATETVSGT